MDRVKAGAKRSGAKPALVKAASVKTAAAKVAAVTPAGVTSAEVKTVPTAGYDARGTMTIFDLKPGEPLPRGFADHPPPGTHPNQAGAASPGPKPGPKPGP